jgi:hypothetical protein
VSWRRFLGLTDYAGLLAQCEELYAAVCFDAEAWSDSALADWIEALASSSYVDKEIGRELRRIVRAAQKLRDFWLAPAAGRPPDHGDWRTRVDIGLGVKAWRPLLAMARLGLSRAPGEELFADVKERFRVVTGERWMEGVDFDDWLADHRA